MDLKEKLKQILKMKYGIETEEDFKNAVEEFPGVDFGIFVNPQKGEVKSA